MEIREGGNGEHAGHLVTQMSALISPRHGNAYCVTCQMTIFADFSGTARDDGFNGGQLGVVGGAERAPVNRAAWGRRLAEKDGRR